MSDLICPFSATLVKNDFGCQYANSIVRRGGAEIACLKSDRHSICSMLHERIKAAALNEMGLEDDLLSLPHSVLVKIQYGGLLGLQAVMEGSADGVEDISSLVTSVNECYTNFSDLPFDRITSAIVDYKLARRGRK